MGKEKPPDPAKRREQTARIDRRLEAKRGQTQKIE